jgi:sporulation protein YlmC with PRC-barrel domain
MIRASGLYGRAIVDLDTAERVGSVDEIIVDSDAPGIAGFVVACDRSLLSARKRVIVPIEAVHAIGPDALTVRGARRLDGHGALLDSLPRLSELTGRRMVSFGGRLLGAMEDALIDERDGRIIGYPLERSSAASWVESLFGLGWRSDRPDYVRADAELRIGARLIVVPDNAIASVADLPETSEDDPPAVSAPAVPEFEHTPAEVEAAQSTTAHFSMRDVLTHDEMPGERVDGVTDEGLGLDAGHHERDPEDDTGLIAAAGLGRGRPRRRQQAERMR